MKLAVANNEFLQSRLDAGLAALVEEANRGEPIWSKQNSWIWGLPTWSRSGRPFRGLAALLLWRAAVNSKVPVAWQEAENQEDPAAVVIPVRDKRGFRPVAMVPAQRLGALPFAVPKWDEPQIEKALAALKLYYCRTLVPIASHIRELTEAFVQALRRHPAPMGHRHSDWTISSLSVAAWIAATAADAAYAAQVGKVFSDEQIWERGDVAALFPWEAQEPGGPLETADRRLKRDGARVLANGKKPGQIPRRDEEVLRLDRIWERGGVLEGYGRVLQMMDNLNIAITGDLVTDTRKVGTALAGKIARLERLPPCSTSSRIREEWTQLKRNVRKKSWAHRLEFMRVEALRYDSRWDADRTIPRVRAVLSQFADDEERPRLYAVRLSQVGLVRLLDAMGPKMPKNQPHTKTILNIVRSVPDRKYQRRPINKSDGTERWLDVPNVELAKAQRLLVEKLRPCAPFAGVATAFEPGRSPALQARMHEGAIAAVVVDIADFFGSIRPSHLRWAFRQKKRTLASSALIQMPPPVSKRNKDRALVRGGTRTERDEIISIFFTGNEKTKWLPQGAPSSPWVANLAAHLLDRRIRIWARDYPFGTVRYSRYADDLVLSLHGAPKNSVDFDHAAIKRFLTDSEEVLRSAIRAHGWTVKEEKTRHWRRDSHVPLTLCGIEVPEIPGNPCRLPRLEHRRAKAALHNLRCGGNKQNHGLLAWAWGATGQPGWLAWTNRKLSAFAISFAGPVLSEAVVGGWADSIDHKNE